MANALHQIVEPVVPHQSYSCGQSKPATFIVAEWLV